MDEAFDAIPGLARGLATAVAPGLAKSLVTRRITPPPTLPRSQRSLSVARPLLAGWPAPDVAEASAFVQQPQLPPWLPDAAPRAVSRSWAEAGEAVDTIAHTAPARLGAMADTIAAASSVVAPPAAAPLEQRIEGLESSASAAVTELSRRAPPPSPAPVLPTTPPLTSAAATAVADVALDRALTMVGRAPALPVPSEAAQSIAPDAGEPATLVTAAAETAAAAGEDAATVARAVAALSRPGTAVAGPVRPASPRGSPAADQQHASGLVRELDRVAMARASRAWEPERRSQEWPAIATPGLSTATGSPLRPERPASHGAATPASSIARPSLARTAQAPAVPTAPPPSLTAAHPASVAAAPPASVAAPPAPAGAASRAQDRPPPSAPAPPTPTAVAPLAPGRAAPPAPGPAAPPQPDHAVPAATEPAAAPGSGPAAPAGAAPAAPPTSGPTAPSRPDPAELAAELFEQLHARLRRELLIERERAGLLASPDRW